MSKISEEFMIIFGVFGILSIATVFYRIIEGFTWLEAVYFSVVTLSTVGYGDLVPKTDVGKLFTVLFIMAGVALVAMALSLLTKRKYP